MFSFLNSGNLDKGIITDMKVKDFFKVLLLYDVLYYKQIDNKNYPSPLIFFSYYFMDREKPLIPIIKTFRQTDMKVHVSPGEKLFASLTNHVVSLRLKTYYSIWEYNEIFRMREIMKNYLGTYEIFEVSSFIIQNYLFTFHFWDNFVVKLRYFEARISKDLFYLTHLFTSIFFLSIIYSLLLKIISFRLYVNLFFISYYYCLRYWFELII